MSTAEGVRAGAGGEREAAATARSREKAADGLPLWLVGVHLAALWALAFVQPLFDLLGKNAAFFVARDNTPGDILILAFGFTLGPPLVLLAVVALARAISRPLSNVLHLVFMTLLAGVLVLQVVKGLSERSLVVVPISLAIAAAIVFAYSRKEGLRSLVSILGVAPVVIIALLLVFSPVSDLVFPSDEPKAAAGSGAASNTPVVLFIFDELPTMSLMTAEKKVDAERYPNFARLARSSTWYQNATSVSDGTYVAVPAILTGLRPKAELPTSREYPRNLFSLLGRTYDQHVQEPITSVCSASYCGPQSRPRQRRRLTSLAEDLKVVEGRLLLPGDLADDLPAIDRDWEDFAADAGDDGLAEAAGQDADAQASASGGRIRVAGNDLPAQRVRAGRAVVRTMKPPANSKGGLWMVHYVVPHVPWRFLPDGTQYVVEGPTIPGLNDQDWGSNRFLLDQAYQRHVLMLKFADNLLGEAIDQMKRSGLWDKALVMVVADHGGAIEPKESRRPVTKGNFAEVAGVPMFVKLPGQKKGATSQTFTTTMDVVPTVAKVLNLNPGWKFDGIPVDEPREPKVLQQRNGREARLVSQSPAAFRRAFDSELRGWLQRFPSGDESIWRVGPRRDLLGRAVSGLSRTAGGGGARIDNASLYGRVRPRSGVSPVYLTGELPGRVTPGTALVAAVNGRIRASGEAYNAEGDRRFSFVLPPETLRRGRNRVEVFSVRGSTLTPLAQAG